MATPDGCPCDAVKELKEIVARHDAAIYESVTSRALINQKLDLLIETVNERKKNKNSIGTGVAVAVASSAVSFIAACVLARFGIIL